VTENLDLTRPRKRQKTTSKTTRDRTRQNDRKQEKKVTVTRNTGCACDESIFKITKTCGAHTTCINDQCTRAHDSSEECDICETRDKQKAIPDIFKARLTEKRNKTEVERENREGNDKNIGKYKTGNEKDEKETRKPTAKAKKNERRKSGRHTKLSGIAIEAKQNKQALERHQTHIKIKLTEPEKQAADNTNLKV